MIKSWREQRGDMSDEEVFNREEEYVLFNTKTGEVSFSTDVVVFRGADAADVLYRKDEGQEAYDYMLNSAEVQQDYVFLYDVLDWIERFARENGYYNE